MKRKEAILHQLVHAVIGGHWLLSSTEKSLGEYTEMTINLAFHSLLDSGALQGFSEKDCAAVYQASVGKSWDALIADRDATVDQEIAQNIFCLSDDDEVQHG